MLTHDRVGQFDIGFDAVENNLDLVRRVLSEVVVVRCEMVYATKSFRYEAIGSGFDEVPPNLLPAYYDIDYDIESDTVTWTKRV